MATPNLSTTPTAQATAATPMSPREVTAAEYRATFERVFAAEIAGTVERTAAYYAARDRLEHYGRPRGEWREEV